MMTWLKRLNAYNGAVMAPADEGGAGGGVDTASVLFPGEGAGDDTQPGGEGDDTQAGGAGDDTAKAGDWKEYENDPAKSEADNAAAKAEHDKTKPADDKAGDAKANEVPADGKYTLTMPDGVELDTELADALGPDFKELNLTNAQAQKLVDKYIATQQARGAKQTEAWTNTVTGWADTAKADPEIGGKHWDDTAKTAVAFIDEFASPAGKEFLNSSGGGNHPEMIRMARNGGKALAEARAKIADLEKQLNGEDNPAIGGAGGSSKPADAASIMFPSDAKG